MDPSDAEAGEVADLSDVVRLQGPFAAETLPNFLRREGPMMNEAIAMRFGWTLGEARKTLHALKQDGVLEADLIP